MHSLLSPVKGLADNVKLACSDHSSPGEGGENSEE